MVDPRFHGERGASLVEILITVGLTGLLAVMGTAFYGQIQKGSTYLQARKAAKQDNIHFLSLVRSTFYLSIPDKFAPAMFSTINLHQSNDPAGYKRVGSRIELTNGSGGGNYLATLSTKCVNAPSNLSNGRLPVMNQTYINGIMNDVNCTARLNGLSCTQNQIPVVALERYNWARSRYLPAGIMAGNTVQRANIDRGVAAIACVVPNTTTGYTTIKIWSAIINPDQSKNPNLNQRVRWYENSMTLAPFSRGNSQYIQ
ncbi:MAG TPA: hypothetical protein PKG95_12435 [Anaerolineaceae bacterium]|nr:hypothetical protein [Anaerolineaceae bacterium]